jgi:hypothetical protein
MDSATRADVHRRILVTDLSRFQPFTLLALEPGENALLVHWTGRESMSEPESELAMPLTSSSFDPLGVGESRKRCYKRAISGSANSAELLFNFHSSHEPALGPYSTCMHRDDARTVSFSWIKVSSEDISFCYYPDSPCSFRSDSDRVSTDVVMPRTLR